MLLNFILFRMDFDDLGALGPFVTPKTKCVLHPPTLQVSSSTLVTPSTASLSLQSNLTEFGVMAGWRVSPVKQNLVPLRVSHSEAELPLSVILLRLNAAAVFSLIRVSKPKLQIELGGVAVLL
jgi:hypothetical protein